MITRPEAIFRRRSPPNLLGRPEAPQNPRQDVKQRTLAEQRRDHADRQADRNWTQDAANMPAPYYKHVTLFTPIRAPVI